MKKKVILGLVVIIVWCFFALTVFAQETEIGAVSATDQIQTLENKVDLLNQINEKILNTIYWALGGLGGIFLGIVGLNSYQNFSLNKQKIDTIKGELQSELSDSFLKFQDKNKNNFAILSEGVSQKIKLEADALKKKFQPQIDDLRGNYHSLKRENLKRSAFEDREGGRLYLLIEMLEMDIKRNWDFEINESLDYISKNLDNPGVDSEDLTELQRVLVKLPLEYSAQRKQIESKMVITRK